MTQRPRLLFLTKGAAINPASRYRFLQYIPHLKAAGFDITVRPLLPEIYYKLGEIECPTRRTATRIGISAFSLARRIFQLPQTFRADLVLLENQVFPYDPGLLDRLALLMNAKLVVEFDDAIYLTPLHRRKLLDTISRAHHVIVGNRHLEAFARQKSARVSVVPTVVNTSLYPEKPVDSGRKGPLRIGWIGLPAGLPFLKTIEPAIQAVAQTNNIEFHIISSQAYDIEGVACRFTPWSEDGEIDALYNLDVGVMPLPDTEWARGKCGLKLLQYMAAGRPAVASPVGVNSEILRHGQDGFLASSTDEWIKSLTKLASEPKLRKELGQHGRQRVLENYSLDIWAPRVASLYRDLIMQPS
jgi:glycosyltransferase involved in cell wall biosynthesis